MNSGEYESYILKEEELKLLLGSLGVKKIYGLLENDSTEKVSEETKNCAIAGLYQNDVVDFSNRGMLIRPEFSGIFSVLRSCRLCIAIHHRKPDIPVRCCYISRKKIAMMERCQSEKKALKVSFWEKQQWLDFFADSMEINVSENIPFGKEKEVKRKWYIDTEKYFQEEGIIAVISLQSSRKQEIYQRLLIWEVGVETWLILHKRENSVQMPYSREELFHMLNAWIGR